MTLSAWRIVEPRHSPTAFSGVGAAELGGRWNSKGVRVIYTASSVPLAILETVVHLESQPVVAHYLLYEVRFEASSMSRVEPADLPENWSSSPAPRELRSIGDRWIAEQRSLVLEVPSAVAPHVTNYLFNPLHPGFAGVWIGEPHPYAFDPRLTR